MEQQSSPETLPGLRIPYQKLDPATLENLIKEFVLREGTDYGAREVDLETKVDQVKSQLERGDAVVLFDPNTETVTIACLHDAPQGG